MNPSADWNRTFAWVVALPVALVVCADAPSTQRGRTGSPPTALPIA